MAEAFTIALIIAAHCVNEIIRAAELLARGTRAIAQRITHRVRSTASAGKPAPS